VWWYKTLYQVEPVVWTSITTSCESDELWCGLFTQQARPAGCKVLYKHTMYVISLSNISIKTNFQQITRVEIRLTNLYNTLRETTSCAWRHVYKFVAVHSIALLALLTLTSLPRNPMIWRHYKIVMQRRSRATSRLSFITTVWWYDILYHTPCIRQATFFRFKGKRTKC